MLRSHFCHTAEFSAKQQGMLKMI